MKKVKEYFWYIIILIVVILVKSFVVSTVRVNGNSMYKTLHNKDLMILNKIKYNFKNVERFDIVVVKYENHYIIKRVIALPGEVIEYKDNVLYINDRKVQDKYNSIEQDNFSLELGNDEYFVMGDNRGDSLDSRIIGPIKKDDIMGNSEFIIFPFTRFGKTN